MTECDLIIKIIIGIMLILCGILDFKTKQISLSCVIVAMFLIITIRILFSYLPFQSMITGLTIGLILIVISKITKDQIGIGDGLIFCCTGLGIGFFHNLYLLLYSLSLAAIYAGFMIVVYRKNRKYSLPFVPFICFGYIGVLLS